MFGATRFVVPWDYDDDNDKDDYTHNNFGEDVTNLNVSLN